VELIEKLGETLASHGEPRSVVKLLIAYIDARLEVLCAGWIE
jgi:hypothetical protein